MGMDVAVANRSGSYGSRVELCLNSRHTCTYIQDVYSLRLIRNNYIQVCGLWD